MTQQDAVCRARREFLRFLAASPYVAALGGVAAFLDTRALGQPAQRPSDIIASPADALNVFDFEEPARRTVMPGHWAYMASGVDDDVTLRANREGYSHVQLRPRRLRDATKVDTRVDLFGTTYASPIFLCPTGGEKSIHPDGELGVARAARARNTLQILSTAASTGIEDVNTALGRPCWYQLYAPRAWEANEMLLRRVEAAGTSVIALTVDNTTGRNSETYLRTRPKDLKQCDACHEGGPWRRPAADDGEPDDARRPRQQSGDGLGVRRPPAEGVEREADHQGHRHARRRAALLSSTASTRSSCRIMADDPPRPDARQSRRCPRWSRKSPDGSPCSWTAASAAAPTCTRRSRSARRPWASDGRFCGGSARSARRGSIASSRSCRASSNSRWGIAGPRRLATSRVRTCTRNSECTNTARAVSESDFADRVRRSGFGVLSFSFRGSWFWVPAVRTRTANREPEPVEPQNQNL